MVTAIAAGSGSLAALHHEAGGRDSGSKADFLVVIRVAERLGDFAPIEKPGAAPKAMSLHLKKTINLVRRIIERRNQKNIGFRQCPSMQDNSSRPVLSCCIAALAPVEIVFLRFHGTVYIHCSFSVDRSTRISGLSLRLEGVSPSNRSSDMRR